MKIQVSILRRVLILAALILLPAVAAADDLSATLGGGCQGLASLVTSSSTITYTLLTDLANPGQATLTGGGVNVNLQANFNGGSASGTVAVDGATLDNIEDGGSTLQIGGNCSGPIVNNGPSGPTGNQIIGFSAPNFDVLETAGEVTVTVQRLDGTDGMVTVDYETSNGTATAGNDYGAANGTLTWADGDAAPKELTVQIFDNTDEDGNRELNVTLSNVTGDNVELGLSAATVTILDDEALVCIPDEDTLCLGPDGRYRVEINWADFQGNSGAGETVDLGLRDSGLFFFFSQDNIEMLIKVLDFCAFNDAVWVFYAATTNVEFTLTVTDTETGETQVYDNTLGVNAAPVIDTAAFPNSCPQ